MGSTKGVLQACGGERHKALLARLHNEETAHLAADDGAGRLDERVRNITQLHGRIGSDNFCGRNEKAILRVLGTQVVQLPEEIVQHGVRLCTATLVAACEGMGSSSA